MINDYMNENKVVFQVNARETAFVFYEGGITT